MTNENELHKLKEAELLSLAAQILAKPGKLSNQDGDDLMAINEEIIRREKGN